MINGLSKHKLFTSSYQELMDSSDDEPLPQPPVRKERIKLAKVEKEPPVIVAKYATKKPRSQKSIRDALLALELLNENDLRYNLYVNNIKPKPRNGRGISASSLKNFLSGSYYSKSKDQKQNIDGYIPAQSIQDWTTNAMSAIGLVHKTKRSKHAKKIQDEAAAKYGNQNILTTGHSLGANKLAEKVGQKSAEVITYNKPFTLENVGKRVSKKQTDIRTNTDPVSLLHGTQKPKLGDQYVGQGIKKKAPSKWIQHVKKHAAKHGVSYRQALTDASATYRKVEVYLGILIRIVLTCFKGRLGGGSFERSIRIYQISDRVNPAEVARKDSEEAWISKILDHRFIILKEGSKEKQGNSTKRKNQGELEFLVRWLNYPKEPDSWEPFKHLRATDQQHEYLRTHKMKSYIPTVFKEPKQAKPSVTVINAKRGAKQPTSKLKPIVVKAHKSVRNPRGRPRKVQSIRAPGRPRKT
eukprot:gene15932-21615_t